MLFFSIYCISYRSTLSVSRDLSQFYFIMNDVKLFFRNISYTSLKLFFCTIFLFPPPHWRLAVFVSPAPECHRSAHAEPPFSSALRLSPSIFSLFSQHHLISPRDRSCRRRRGPDHVVYSLKKQSLKKGAVFRAKTSDCLLIFICVVE